MASGAVEERGITLAYTLRFGRVAPDDAQPYTGVEKGR